MSIKKEVMREFLSLCMDKFGNRLKCIVLYGSRAKGIADEYSDWDFFVTVESLPRERRARSRVFLPIRVHLVKQLHQSLQVVSVTPSELLKGPIRPLIYGILTGYQVLYGREFWERYLGSIKQEIKKSAPTYIEGEKEWKIPEII